MSKKYHHKTQFSRNGSVFKTADSIFLFRANTSASCACAIESTAARGTTLANRIVWYNLRTKYVGNSVCNFKLNFFNFNIKGGQGLKGG